MITVSTFQHNLSLENELDVPGLPIKSEITDAAVILLKRKSSHKYALFKVSHTFYNSQYFNIRVASTGCVMLSFFSRPIPSLLVFSFSKPPIVH